MNDDRATLEHRILAERARELARPVGSGQEADSSPDRFVSVSLGEETYAFDARYVICASHALTVVALPGSVAPLAGITVYEGEILPVFNLRDLVGMTPCADSRSTWILVLGKGSADIGLIVDRVNTVSPVDTTTTRPNWVDATASPTVLLTSTTPDGITIMDVEHLLRDERLTIDTGQSNKTEANV